MYSLIIIQVWIDRYVSTVRKCCSKLLISQILYWNFLHFHIKTQTYPDDKLSFFFPFLSHTRAAFKNGIAQLHIFWRDVLCVLQLKPKDVLNVRCINEKCYFLTSSSLYFGYVIIRILNLCRFIIELTLIFNIASIW